MKVREDHSRIFLPAAAGIAAFVLKPAPPEPWRKARVIRSAPAPPSFVSMSNVAWTPSPCIIPALSPSGRAQCWGKGWSGAMSARMPAPSTGIFRPRLFILTPCRPVPVGSSPSPPPWLWKGSNSGPSSPATPWAASHMRASCATALRRVEIAMERQSRKVSAPSCATPIRSLPNRLPGHWRD